MGGGDISDSAKLGICVMILCFLIGIVFQLFTMTRTQTSKSANQLQGSFNQLSDSAFATYDNTTVFGSQVKNAVITYQAEKFCIVVNNTPETKVSINELRDDNVKLEVPTAAGVKNGDYNILKTDNAQGGARSYYYGYPLANNGSTSTPAGNWNAAFSAQTGEQDTYFTANVMFNKDKSSYTSAITSPGQAEVYVNDARRYQSYLIKDTTGEVVGIVFQMLKN